MRSAIWRDASAWSGIGGSGKPSAREAFPGADDPEAEAAEAEAVPRAFPPAARALPFDLLIVACSLWLAHSGILTCRGRIKCSDARIGI
jgi:hypothetical protein